MSTPSNRVIKFRVWDAQASKYLENEVMWSVASLPQDMMPGQPPFIPFLMVALNAPSDKYIVEQFTGLQDSKGQDIYEGDIVEHKDLSSIGTVSFSEQRGQYEHNCPILSKHYRWTVWNVKVIGNIHEHPYLLNPSSP